jgi:protein-L-isoaspartate(D-aspartate) O-methyltransferase
MHSALKALWGALLVGLSVLSLPAIADAADPALQRLEMVRTIEQYARYTGNIVGEDGLSPRVLDVMRTVQRQLFVPERHRSLAYDDRPVEIGFGQTISQPFIVALMTHLLELGPDHVVLEIGTGSGYQAAVLSPLVRRVCTIEVITELGEAAAERLTALGYANVETKITDGYYGWPECGPFDGIVVTAAADHVPPPLVDQLKPGGRMVIPVGGMFAVQHLTLVEKTGSGEVLTRQLLPVRFVPFTRREQ